VVARRRIDGALSTAAYSGSEAKDLFDKRTQGREVCQNHAETELSVRPCCNWHCEVEKISRGAEIQRYREANNGSCRSKDTESEKCNNGDFDSDVNLHMPEQWNGAMAQSVQGRVYTVKNTYINAQNQSEKIETAESAKLNPVMLLGALHEPPGMAFQFIWIGVQ
jgi:hypothetical protein